MKSIEAYILQNRQRPVAELALELHGHADADFALRQVEGWQRLRRKVPSWAETEGLHFPRRLSVEQCSGEAAARYKAGVAKRLAGGRNASFADLTGGFGVDFAFIAKEFSRATYVEQQEELCQLARHNLPLLGLPQAEVVCCEAEQWLSQTEGEGAMDLIFLDPARRDPNGHKTFRLADCTPNAAALLPMLLRRAPYVMLKLSPMLDVTQALAELCHHCAEIHVVGSGGECKELLVVCSRATTAEPRFSCVGDGLSFDFSPAENAQAAPLADHVLDYLFEPDVTLMKAGAFNVVAHRFRLLKLAPNTHLYTSAEPCADFPGRSFKVRQTVGFDRRSLRCLSGQKANLSVRNFPDSVAALRHRLRLTDGGTDYWFATTLANGSHVIVCGEKI